MCYSGYNRQLLKNEASYITKIFDIPGLIAIASYLYVVRQLLKNVASYITRIFDILGLIAKEESVGFPSSASGAADLETLVRKHSWTIGKSFGNTCDAVMHLVIQENHHISY